MTRIPTDQTPQYRDRTGVDHTIEAMTDEQLLRALYDMLIRTSRNSHKINKLFEISDTLSHVTKALHQELKNREGENVTPLVNLQIASDLGQLELKETEDQVSIAKTVRHA